MDPRLLSSPLHNVVEAGQGHELGVEGVAQRQAEVGEAHRDVGGAADGWGLLLEQITVTIPALLSRVMRVHAEVPIS